MKTKKKAEPKTHGGKRKGSGRPESAQKTVPAPFRIYPDTALRLKSLAEKNNMSTAEFLETVFPAPHSSPKEEA